MNYHKHAGLRRLLIVSLAFALAWSGSAQPAETIDPTPVRGRYFVSPFGNDEWSGKIPEPNATRTDGPFKTFVRARKAHRDDTVQTRIIVRQGVYQFAEPLVLEKIDSGSSYEAYPGERVVVSGGRPILNWQKGSGSAWAANIPEVRRDRWQFRQLRVGDEMQINARHPDFDPNNPYEGGWAHVEGAEKKIGQFGVGISKIHNRGDWVEWAVSVPADGNYRILFLYQAANRRYRIADVGERMSLSIDGGAPVKLKNLTDSARFTWAEVASVTLTEGAHNLRWTNDEGGFLNLDALLLTDDPAWDPLKSRTPAAGRAAVTQQAEIIENHGCQEIVIPESRSPSSRTAFKFAFGDIPALARSIAPEYHIFTGTGAGNTILYQRRLDLRTRTVSVEAGSNASNEILPGSRFFVSNIMEGLTSPGEWYLDTRRATLFYWPKALDFQQKGVVAPFLDRIIHLKGDPSKNDFVEAVTIKGLTFMDTTYSRNFNPLLPTDAALWLSGAKNCVVEGNRFLHLGGNAIRLDEQSLNNEIVGNEIAHTGQGGIVLLGDNQSQPKKTVIAGNWMHHLGTVLKHVAGVYAVSASETRVAHNLFEELPRYAISLKSVSSRGYSHGNVVEYNEIRRTCLETAGGAAIETSGPHKMDTGNVIRYNRIHETVGLTCDETGEFQKPFLSWGILLDAYSSGTTVLGNEVVGNAQGALCITGGKNNRIENNVFANGLKHQVLFRVDPSSEKNSFVRNILQYTLIEGDFIGSTGRWSPKFLNLCDYNIYWQTEGVGYLTSATKPLTPLGNFAKWQSAGFDKNSSIVDPGFVDALKNNFTLQAGSPAFTKISFQPIPYDQIGLSGFERSWKKP